MLLQKENSESHHYFLPKHWILFICVNLRSLLWPKIARIFSKEFFQIKNRREKKNKKNTTTQSLQMNHFYNDCHCFLEFFYYWNTLNTKNLPEIILTLYFDRKRSLKTHFRKHNFPSILGAYVVSLALSIL